MANNQDREDKQAEWVPENAGSEFTTNVMGGVKAKHDGFQNKGGSNPNPVKVIKRPNLTVDDYVEGVLSGDRAILSRAITLIESNSSRHIDKAQEVLKKLLPHTGNSMRVGITGVPGAGKSTFIEAMGSYLCDNGHNVAVLAIDPSSTVTKGSILGDKTRMETLARRENAFIRPSPSGGTLGGVTRKSRETMLVCEAAGFDVLLIETVGVGQSEVTVRSLVDFFLLVAITGAGDELQGIKKGVMELADAIMVNKCDGDNVLRAKTSRAEYNRILHYLRPATEGWKTQAFAASSYTGYGIDNVWNVIQKFKEVTQESGVFEDRRKQQTIHWVYSMVNEHLENLFYDNQNIKSILPSLEAQVVAGEISATMAVKELIRIFEAS